MRAEEQTPLARAFQAGCGSWVHAEMCSPPQEVELARHLSAVRTGNHSSAGAAEVVCTIFYLQESARACIGPALSTLVKASERPSPIKGESLQRILWCSRRTPGVSGLPTQKERVAPGRGEIAVGLVRGHGSAKQSRSVRRQRGTATGRGISIRLFKDVPLHLY